MPHIQRVPLCLIEILDHLDIYIVTPIEGSKPLHALACIFATDEDTKSFVEYYTHAPYHALHAYHVRKQG